MTHLLKSKGIQLACIASLVLASCTKEVEPSPESGFILPATPAWFPEPPYPADNAFTPERWALGKQLFFDPDLSLHKTVSCGSCHLPDLAFSDSMPTSAGDMGAPGTSNTPALFNLAYHPYFTRAGGVPTLEMQVAVPVQEHNEFNHNMADLVLRLSQNADYESASQLAYGRSFDAFTLTRALAVFERSLISGNSAYDRFHFQGEASSLSAAEKRGMELFFSDRTNCSSCHAGFNFTTYTFENNGLYEVYADSGRMRFTHLEDDRARFKVPSLRNVALTAPYMHDGSMNSLEDVVAHYNHGGADHPNKSPLIRPLNLSASEQSDLVAFLHSLTDYTFVNQPLFKP
jgi:cytochrome c peroxidase